MSLQVLYRPSKLSMFAGNSDLKKNIQTMMDRKDPPSSYLIVGPSGCVDKDTEFLSPKGWIKISEYNGEQVLQWNKDNRIASFVHPTEYIKQKSNKLTEFKTKYGVDQCLSDAHNFLYYLPKTDKFYDSIFKDIKDKHNNSNYGFSGKILTSFYMDIDTKMSISDAELRVQVMFNADGSIVENRKKICVNLKKKRKIDRAELLLNNAGITFDKYIMSNGYIRFYFVPPLREKTYTNDYFKCSEKQLKIIADEVLFWDGDQKSRYSTTIKKDADFIQYVFSVTGNRSSIYTYIRNGKPEYGVEKIKNIFVGIASNKKVQMKEIIPKDGFEYCFTVPSSYLVLRRNDKIFITGNCGKTTLGRIIARMLGCAKIDFKEMNSANDRTLKPLRAMLENLKYAPLKGKKKVVLLDEAHQILSASQEALLKALEEPPSHVHFIICTTNPEALKDTFKRRCHIYEVQLLTSSELTVLIRRILKNEKIKEFPDEIIDKVIELSDGSAGIALKNLDMVIDMKNDVKGALRVLKSSGSSEEDVKEICKALINFNISDKARWTRIRKLLSESQVDGESARRSILGYLSKVLLNNPLDNNNDLIAAVMSEFTINFYDSGKSGLYLSCYMACNVGEE